MNTTQTISKKLSLEFGIDERVVYAIICSPFRFAKEKIEDDNDETPIRIRYLFKLLYKEYHKKENRCKTAQKEN